jgi:hypothetical protein
MALAYQAKTDNSLRLLTPLALIHALKADAERAEEMSELLQRFSFVVPPVRASRPVLITAGGAITPDEALGPRNAEHLGFREVFTRTLRPFHTAAIRQTVSFPDRWLVQYDAGGWPCLIGQVSIHC